MAITNADGSIILTTKIDEKGIKTGLKNIKKYTLALGVALGTTSVAITKMAVSAYADYEQLVGGVETLFKQSARKVIDYANDAFYTAGISANEYMRQVTSFSASLIRSTAGDTDKAADIANMALIDISDNVNKMGSSMESVTLAYQGFAKQQYMLLDNLKLGYGGTKTEMERLLKDAQSLTGVKYDINNLADVYSAIHAIQEKLGIAGTTAKEAESTISGSANMVKASWENVLSAISGGGNLDRAINNLVYSLTKYFNKIVPVVERALIGIGILIEQIAPLLIQTVARSIIRAIPSLVRAIYSMIIGLANGIREGLKALFSGETVDIQPQLDGIASSSDEASSSMEKLGKETEKAGKKAKKSLASFDELNTISQDTSSGTNVGGFDIGDLGVDSIGGLSDYIDGSKIVSEIDETLTKIMAIAGMALVAIGVILLMTGNLGWGVGFIIAGAVTFGVAMATLKNNAISQKVKDSLTKVVVVAGIVAIALGVIACIGGAWAIGVGLIISGAMAVGTTASLNWNGIKEALKGPLGTAIAIAGIVAIVFGVLACVAQHWALGIGLIVTGALSVGTIVAVNWQSIKQALQGPLGTAIAVVGVVAIVLGVLICCTGNFGLGIGLILTGATAIGATMAVNWDAILNKIKDLCQKVKNYWNSNIAKYFTATWWGNLAKNAINGFLKWIVNGLNKLIDKLNSFGFKLPDVLGGGRVGFNISRLRVPQLAQGAVLPPNKPFLAVVGDQKHGTNIEAPLDTIKQGVAEVVANMNVGSNFNGRIEVPVYLDSRQIALAVREAENNLGSQTVFGGFANAY